MERKDVIFICESKSIILSVSVFSNPLSTLKAIIKVATPSEIPVIEITEMKLIKRESFFEKIYFLEINQGRFIK